MKTFKTLLIVVSFSFIFTLILVSLHVFLPKGTDFAKWEEQQKKVEQYNQAIKLEVLEKS